MESRDKDGFYKDGKNAWGKTREQVAQQKNKLELERMERENKFNVSICPFTQLKCNIHCPLLNKQFYKCAIQRIADNLDELNIIKI